MDDLLEDMDASRILVVEDDDAVADYLNFCLVSMGYMVVDVCCYGEDAVGSAQELRPDLILMDIKLKGAMSGLEAATRIHSLLDIPVVFLTAYGEDDVLQSAKVTDPFGYLLKPFRESELRHVIEIALYRYRMEKELREREVSYRILAENLPGIVCRSFLDESEKILFFNDMLEKMTGFREEELPRGNCCRMVSLALPEDRQAVIIALSRAFVEEEPYEVEYRIRRKDGNVRYFLERGRITKPQDGAPSFIDSVILDITGRRSAEEKLEQAYLKLMDRQTFIESILSNIQSGIIVIDSDIRIKLMNPSAENFLDVSGEALTNRDLGDACTGLADAVRGKWDNDEFYCNACPREHVVGFKTFDMKGKDGTVNGHIISFADLTEIVKIRKEMKRKEQLAAIGEFVARVAHEIRNPLFGMTAICQIFSMELTLNDEHKKLMDSMMKEAWRLKQIVDELLDCSRELKIVRKRCDLAGVVNDTLFENGPLANQKSVSIEKNIPDGGFPFDADQDKIKQVILNLLKNAVEASSPNGVIRISLEKDDTSVTFSISDFGPGIPGNIQDKIFDVFYTTKKHGTGLGLTISKNIIVAHGGSMWAENRPEGGATFVFTLPVSC